MQPFQPHVQPQPAPTSPSAPPDVERETVALRQVTDELRRVIVGQDYLLDRLLVGLLARGHVLIEGVPGLAKTLAVKTLARTLHLDFQRIQFTPDLLPADLVGTLIYDQRTQQFHPRKGPVFAHLLLADEINRAPAKVQSALLEAMEERQVTIGDATWPLPDPFMVLATQNPIEQEGTYPLAEAQVDRFMMKLALRYPSRAEEQEILDRMLVEREIEVRRVLDAERLAHLRRAADGVYLDGRLRRYVIDLVTASRDPRAAGLGELADLVAFGASPRATLFLARAAKALALVRGRGYVVPEDVKEVAPDVLRHRVVPSYEAEAEEVTADQLVARILERVEVP
ncbi:MAG TPA: AAA family ATPase [Thermoanaerobaculia bacterium]|nr:AAA family ATPase [Thermoanaerobaculia bacterium]